MVLIELEPEPEPEKAARPSPPVPEEQAEAAEAGGEAARASSPPGPGEQAGAAAGGEEPRAEQADEEEEEAFEDALTDEQLREVGRYLPDRRRFVPRREVKGGEGSRRGEGRRRRPAGSRVFYPYAKFHLTHIPLKNFVRNGC